MQRSQPGVLRNSASKTSGREKGKEGRREEGREEGEKWGREEERKRRRERGKGGREKGEEGGKEEEREGGREGGRERESTCNREFSCEQEEVILWRSSDHNQSLQTRQNFYVSLQKSLSSCSNSHTGSHQDLGRVLRHSSAEGWPHYYNSPAYNSSFLSSSEEKVWTIKTKLLE